MKKYPVMRYVAALRIDHKKCQVCAKKLERCYLLFNGNRLDRKTISKMNHRIDSAEWKELRNQIQVLCRFCWNISMRENFQYFDIPSFKYYLTVETELKTGSIIEYSRRLKKLQNLFEKKNIKFIKNHPTKIEFIEQFKGDVTDDMLGAYARAIEKYNVYESWKSENN